MTSRPLRFFALAALTLSLTTTAAMAHPPRPRLLPVPTPPPISCQEMVQVQSVSAFPRVAVGCGMDPNGPRGYVNASTLYRFINNGGRGIVISESQEISPNQWGPHPMGINGRQAYDAKGNNVIVIP